MDSNLIIPEFVDISQPLGINGADFQLKNIPLSTVPKPPIMPQEARRKPLKTIAKSSKTSKSAAGPSDPDLTFLVTAVPASNWDCCAMETTRDHAWCGETGVQQQETLTGCLPKEMEE